MEIKTIFRNYGKLADFSADISVGRILLIEASNGAGKSTIKTAFGEAFSGLAIKTNPLKQGEEEGWTELHIPDKDGNIVIVKHDFNKFNQEGTFIITDH